MRMREICAAALVAALVFPALAGTASQSAKSNKKTAASPTATRGPEFASDATEAVKEILGKVEEAQTSAKDVQMDLKMSIQDSYSGQKQSVRGVVKIKPPSCAFVHYTTPTEQFLYINGSSMQMYQPVQNMVFKPSKGKGQPTYLEVGKALKKQADTSRVSIIKDSSDKVVLLFVPDGGESQFKRMKVTIRKAQWWPEKVEIQSDTMTSIAQFLNPVFNQGIPDSEFKFTPPVGVSVVEGESF